MSAERQKKIYESIGAARDMLVTPLGDDLFDGLIIQIARGLALEPQDTAATLNRWIAIELENQE